jgi:hypothetical protein
MGGQPPTHRVNNLFFYFYLLRLEFFLEK